MSLFESPEKKIRTFFSEYYPQFLIEIYIHLNDNNIDNRVRQDYINTIGTLYKKFEVKLLKIKTFLNKFKDQYNLSEMEIKENEYDALNNVLKIDITKSLKTDDNLKRLDILKNIIKGRITEFLNNEKLKPKREQLQNLIIQQPVSSIPGGGKRKTNKKKRVNNKKSKRNSQRKRKSKRVNRKM
jgi:hypothetical protein